MSQTPPAFDEARNEAYRYFRYMADFVGFSDEDAAAIRESRFIIEKHIPEIVAKFYNHLLTYPPTRKYFLKPDGSIDQEYLQLRMHHLTNFWRRTASTELDENFAHYVDYVGRAHTSHGADPKIYIPERYVIGQVGFVQHAVSDALETDLAEIDPVLGRRAAKGWSLLMMVILEMLSRAYSNEREVEPSVQSGNVDPIKVAQLAVETYERNLGLYRTIEYREAVVARADEIPEGERKIVQVEGLSIGVFHHEGAWYALRNHCLHRSGPVCTGTLAGDVITCPWHGYQYDVTNGRLLMDPSAGLDMYPVEVRDGEIFLQIPVMTWEHEPVILEDMPSPTVDRETLQDNEFRVEEIPAGRAGLVRLNNQRVAVYNVEGEFYATQDACTHAAGPLSEGGLEGICVTCPWHGSVFDVRDGSVQRGPATKELRTYRVEVVGGIGRVIGFT